MMNKTDLRKIFPITQKCIYLNHASTGPLSSQARKVIDDCLQTYQEQAELDLDVYWRRIREARTSVAGLLGVEANEIAFTGNTSEGVFIGLSNLPLKNGDKILIMDEVFPAVRYVVDNNFPQYERIYAGFSGKSGIEAVKQFLDDRLRVVVVDFVQYLSGETIDINELGKFLHEHGIYLVVDGIQAIGAVECDLSQGHVDVLSCGASKWLLGPSGIGFVYINKAIWKDLNSVHAGWLGADWHDFYDCRRTPAMFQDARKYEIGTRNVLGILALAENVRLIESSGIKNIYSEILGLKRKLREKLRDQGCMIITPENGIQSGILTVKHPQGDRIYRRMVDERIVISLRSGHLRYSPHFYNTIEEIEIAASQVQP